MPKYWEIRIMLLDYIARYYKFLWLALIGVAFLKIILSYSFNDKIKGIHNILFALFKWYSVEEQEMEDYEPNRVIMRFHNIITLTIYIIILLLIIAVTVSRIFVH